MIQRQNHADKPSEFIKKLEEKIIALRQLAHDNKEDEVLKRLIVKEILMLHDQIDDLENKLDLISDIGHN